MQSKIDHVRSDSHWLRQYDEARTAKVYQIVELPRKPEDRPVIIAMTSKKSAKAFIAAVAEQGEAERYRVSCFEHPEFNFER
jgi:hypothetical protein